MNDLIEQQEVAISCELAWLERLIQMRHNTISSGKNYNHWLYDLGSSPTDEDISIEFVMYQGDEQIEKVFNLQEEIHKQLIKLYDMGWEGYGKY